MDTENISDRRFRVKYIQSINVFEYKGQRFIPFEQEKDISGHYGPRTTD